MIIKEEIFVICDDDVPNFTSDKNKNPNHKFGSYIITDKVLEDCIYWLEDNEINKPIIYLGLWFEKQPLEYGTQRNWEIDTKLMSRIVKLNGTLCLSIY